MNPPERHRAASRGRPIDRIGIVMTALQQGREIECSGQRLRLFRRGQMICLTSGYFVLDEDRLLRRHGSVRRRGIEEAIWSDDATSVSWLINRSGELSDDYLVHLMGDCTIGEFQCASAKEGRPASARGPMGSNVVPLSRP